ncbi:hypothetical protein P692DRAFT_201812036 [Suillus brevipes Sb2]|nr:hypothetical protein P692DRAFT_201812036 [Suillus brevipes Sb2]
MQKAFHRLPCPVAAPLSIPLNLLQARESKRHVNPNETPSKSSTFLSDKSHTWFQKKKKKPEPQPVVYDDEFDGDDDEEEENVPVPVTTPPRVQHEEIELKPMAGQAQPEAGPSRLAAANHAEAQSS